MAHIFNEQGVDWRQRQAPNPEFSWHTSESLSELVQSRQFTFYIRSLDPGKYSFPYHFHRIGEEIFVVLSGRATLRTPAGFREIAQGDVVFFETGPAGAHQLYNHTDFPFRFLDLGSLPELDVCEYPDSGKVSILPCDDIYQTKNRVEYYLDEENVKAKWDAAQTENSAE